jgi:Ion channel
VGERDADSAGSGERWAAARTRRGWSLGRRLRARDSYGVLLALIVVLLITTALAGRSPLGRGVVAVLQGGVLLYALWTSRAERRALGIALVMVPAIVAVAAVAAGRTSDAAVAAVAAAGAALSLGAIGAIGRQLVTHPRISGATILGALCTYLLIGMLFASVFATVNAVSSTPFFVTETDPRSLDFLYFSYVTLTTVGYGDLTAAGDLGRMLVTEALLGQLYLVTVVAVVIGNLGRERSHP